MPDLADLITVLLVTSPTASDPSTETIDATIASVRGYEDLANAWMWAGFDDVRPAQRDLANAYEGKWWALKLDERCNMVRLTQWGHQANVLRHLLLNVETPLILFMEHDTPFLPVPIDWQGCAAILCAGELDLIRFHHESHVLPEHAHLMLDAAPQEGTRVPYLRTVQWSQRPHLARTDWYRDLIATYFAPSSRCFVEDCLYGVANYAWREHGMAGWERFRLALYADPEPTMQRSYHLDGRGDDVKGGQVFAYVGETPEGAPAPTLSRVFEE